MLSSDRKRRFPAPWRAEDTRHGFVVRDANGVALAHVYARDDLMAQKWGNFLEHLTSDEARRIAKGIASLPELLNGNGTFEQRHHSARTRFFNPARPYHVALEDFFARERYEAIAACCEFNDVPFDATGEVIEHEGQRFVVYEFMKQFEAIRFWHKFSGRWMRGDEFIYPAPPYGLIPMRSLNRPGAL